MILSSQDDWDWDDTGTTDGTTFTRTDYPIATAPMVAGQRDLTFPVSLKILKIKRVDVTYNGSTYFKAEAIDSSEIVNGLGNDTDTDSRYVKDSPRYDPKANSLWVYPMASAADVASGAKVRIEFFREPSEFVSTDTTKTPGIDTTFQPFIAVLASLDYAVWNDLSRQGSLKALADDFEVRLKQYYGRKNEDVVYSLSQSRVQSYQ